MKGQKEGEMGKTYLLKLLCQIISLTSVWHQFWVALGFVWKYFLEIWRIELVDKVRVELRSVGM